ncbi:MAG: GNAT family N-acetyltransferase [Opitutaceae bacterium]|nr:GNAT family N-acetyltransferase [Opitutaceae bacterium]
MTCRSLVAADLPVLLELLAELHPDDPRLMPGDPVAQRVWEEILNDRRLRTFGLEVEGQVVSTCTLVLVPNLTRGCRPYGVIENVVTRASLRSRGFGTALLRQALAVAWDEGCYKVMLETGAKSEATLRFYEQAGFVRGVKTGFVAYP